MEWHRRRFNEPLSIWTDLNKTRQTNHDDEKMHSLSSRTSVWVYFHVHLHFVFENRAQLFGGMIRSSRGSGEELQSRADFLSWDFSDPRKRAVLGSACLAVISYSPTFLLFFSLLFLLMNNDSTRNIGTETKGTDAEESVTISTNHEWSNRSK